MRTTQEEAAGIEIQRRFAFSRGQCAFIGLGEACKICLDEMDQEKKKLESMRQKFHEIILKSCKDVYLNGSEHHRIPGNLNLSLRGGARKWSQRIS